MLESRVIASRCELNVAMVVMTISARATKCYAQECREESELHG
jgi:hypothetical protein